MIRIHRITKFDWYQIVLWQTLINYKHYYQNQRQ
jgi:hypothetical protein